MVNANRRTIGVDGQLIRVRGEAQRCGIQRRVGLDHVRRVEGSVVRHDMARIGRFVPEATRRVDRAQHAHQHRQRTHGLKSVRVRRQATHGVKGDGAGLRGRVYFAPSICPGNGHLKRLLERGVTHLMRQLADACRVNARDGGCPLGRTRRHTITQQLK